MRQWAFLYLIISAFGFALSGLPYILGVWYNFLYIPLSGGILAFFAWIYFNKENLIDFMKAKSTKSGLSNGASILLGVIIFVAVNFLSVRYNQSIDITKDKINSLSEESVNVLKNLEAPTKLVAYYQGKQHAQAKLVLKRIFELYTKESDKITYEVSDVHSDPAAAKYLTNEDKNKLVILVQSGEKSERVADPVGEESITTALIRLKSQAESKIYFTVGHGERALDDESANGLSTLKQLLNARGFELADLSLLNTKDGKVPSDASAIVIFGPRKSFLPQEIKVLSDYQKNGGKILLTLDPDSETDMSGLLKSWGVKYNKDFVVSVESVMPLFTIGSVFNKESEVTKKLKNAQVLLPIASSFSVEETKGFLASPIVSTNEFSFSAKSPEEVQKTLQEIQSRGSMQGNVFDLVLQVEENKQEHTSDDGHEHGADTLESLKEKAEQEQGIIDPSFKALLVGDSDFAANEYINNAYNKDLILNALVFLSGQKGMVSIHPNTASATEISITPTGLKIGLMGALIIPLIFLFLSLFFLVKRRAS